MPRFRYGGPTLADQHRPSPIGIGVRPLMVAATVLLALAFLTAPVARADDSSFDDVSDGHAYKTAIEWMIESGITKGCNPPANTKYCPEDPVTRAQLAVFLSRALNLPPGETTFTDTNNTDHAADIAKLADAEITRGCNPPANTKYCPEDPVTRAQLAVFLFNALGEAPPEFLDGDPGIAEAGESYAFTPLVRGGAPPFRWKAEGLPDGLSVDSRTGRIDGTTDSVGLFEVNVTATDARDRVARRSYELEVAGPLAFSSTPVPTAAIDEAYSLSLVAVGGSRPYAWAVEGLPEGLRLGATTGTISGRPRQSGTFRISVEVADAEGSTETGSLTLIVSAPPAGCEGNNSIPDTECGALAALYRHTGGARWSVSTNWLTGDPCHWYGVSCDRGTVVALDLYDNALAGEIPAEIAQITNLRELYLDSNSLTGEIPASLGRLTRLEQLWLGENSLKGAIPKALGQLERLRTLDLSGNALTYGIPAELGNLGDLRNLYLDNNSLTGRIPPDFGELTSLESINLSGNPIAGSLPPELGQLGSLNSLAIQDTLMSGDIPDSFTNLDLALLRVRGFGCFTASPGTAAWLGKQDSRWNAACPTG